jgi:phage tail sheath protein FI
VNAALVAHAQLRGDRICYINGDNGLSASAAQTDKLNYVHQNVVYVEPWARILDDVTGAKHDVPPAPFAASVAAQVSPSTSIAWKSSEVGQMLGGVVELVALRDASAGDNTDLGICTFIQEADGSFRFEADVNTVNASNPAKGSIRRSRMLIFIGRAFVENTREIIDAPNVPVNQQDAVNALDRLLSGLKRAKNLDPNHTPHINDYVINLDGANSVDDIQSGNFTIPVEVQISAAIAKLILSLNIGETVTIVEQQ